MGLITLRHAHTHNAAGTDPLVWSDLVDGMSAADIAALRNDLGVGYAVTYTVTDNLAVATGAKRFYVEGSTKIVGVRISAVTAPTGSSILVDINKNGTTVFTTQANRPAIAASANASSFTTNMDVTSLVAGDYLTVDIDQVGSTVAGADLTVTITLRNV